MKKKYIFYLLFVITTIIFGCFTYLKFQSDFLRVYFFDVGQGDSIFINSPKGYQILVDGGPSSKVLQELSETMSFFDRTIDYVILTHPDNDHIFGLIQVLKRYNVKKIVFTGVYDSTPNYQEFLKEISEKNIDVLIADDDNDIFLDDNLYIDVLYPFSPLLNKKVSELNESSVVLKIFYGKNSIFLSGDMNKKIENELIEKNLNLKSTVLKVSHHGSKTSTSETFLNKISPFYSVIQVGENNKFGHPANEILERLIEKNISILRNDINGRIEVVFDLEKIIKINSEHI